ncbi:MAG: hydantoinase B/oxoprolinase family protein [Pseudomonadota bacterium]
MTTSTTRLQVMWDRLLAVVEEQGQALLRAAFSPIVRECGDISAGIFDADGRMLAQAVTGTPGHINTMAEAVRQLRRHFPGQAMRPGDIYLTNDPWIASGHLNDFLLMMPVFYRGRVVAFTACTSHLVDLGGQGMGPEGSDIFDEGLRLPPCTLVREGRIDAVILDIVKANSREPIANEGDIYALIACCEAGADRLQGMLAEFDVSDLAELSRYIIETSHRGTFAAIAELPRGTWCDRLTLDGYDTPITLAATLTINDDGVSVDFAGTDPCAPKGINVPLNYATAYTVFALRCLIGPDIPNNAGSLAPFHVTGPPGCILNAQPPAPVAMRHTIGQMTPDLVYGCLSQALPDQVPAEGASCMWDLPLRSAPDAMDRGDVEFALELVFNGGTGARPTRDGLSATAFPSGVWGSQIETTEAVAPILFERRELRCDSGGPGQFRGGLGQRVEVRASGDQDLLAFLSVERVLEPARGRRGGADGACGRIRLGATGPDLPGKGVFRIPAGETLIFETPGGGGFGPAAARRTDQRDADIAAGFVSSKPDGFGKEGDA